MKEVLPVKVNCFIFSSDGQLVMMNPPSASAGADGSVIMLDECSGRMDYVRFSADRDGNPVTVIKLDTMENEHYADIPSLRPILADLLFRKYAVTLVTHNCYFEDFGFAAFYIEESVEE